MIATLLIGEPSTGKTRALETLPGGTVGFFFDKGGWHSLDPSYTPPTIPGKATTTKRRLKRLKFPPKDNPTLKGWLATNDKLERDEILVLEYIQSDPIGLQQYVRSDSGLFLTFANDFNELWFRRDECHAKGIWHTAIDSLTTFKNAVLEFIISSNARVIATMQDWGQAINKILEVIDSAKGTEFDFVFTCHIQSEKDEITGRVKELPLVYGKGLPKELLTRFDDKLMAGSERGPQGMVYYWAPVPEGLLSGIGTRSFDDLPGRIAPDFAKLYGERLIH